ncbi:hypothetical protein [Paenibacillus sp. sgz302251]|uniref:hypothetical protein n=1 Tax=Paenibacillus sp. sgz302251 TaxID=3414493 RepID=UPI003C7C6C2E
MSFLLSRLHEDCPTTALLSLAPGGMDQMGIPAISYFVYITSGSSNIKDDFPSAA